MATLASEPAAETSSWRGAAQRGRIRVGRQAHHHLAQGDQTRTPGSARSRPRPRRQTWTNATARLPDLLQRGPLRVRRSPEAVPQQRARPTPTGPRSRAAGKLAAPTRSTPPVAHQGDVPAAGARTEEKNLRAEGPTPGNTLTRAGAGRARRRRSRWGVNAPGQRAEPQTRRPPRTTLRVVIRADHKGRRPASAAWRTLGGGQHSAHPYGHFVAELPGQARAPASSEPGLGRGDLQAAHPRPSTQRPWATSDQGARVWRARAGMATSRCSKQELRNNGVHPASFPYPLRCPLCRSAFLSTLADPGHRPRPRSAGGPALGGLPPRPLRLALTCAISSVVVTVDPGRRQHHPRRSTGLPPLLVRACRRRRPRTPRGARSAHPPPRRGNTLNPPR